MKYIKIPLQIENRGTNSEGNLQFETRSGDILIPEDLVVFLIDPANEKYLSIAGSVFKEN